MFNTKEVPTIDELVVEMKASTYQYKVDRVVDAYNFASKRHAGHIRKSGAPLEVHLLATAAYMVRLGLDTTSVIAALLHESLEKVVSTVNELDELFGTEVAFIVDGVTNQQAQTLAFKLHNEDPQNFRHLILSSSEDIRILLVRLANKIHNLQTWQYLDNERRLNQANKTILVYAPLCEYLGLGAFQRIFEDKAFEVLEPEKHRMICHHIDTLAGKNAEILSTLEKELHAGLLASGVKVVQITSRAKSPLSAWRKVQKKHMESHEELTPAHLNKLNDAIGIRIIVDTVPECYLTLGLLHAKYEYNEEEFDDYIVKPKPSGYRSIHTVVRVSSTPIDIQIRTQEMHEYNEFGSASHIAYKLGSKKGQEHTWTKELVEWQNKEVMSKDKYKIRAFSESIFVFTPKGEIIRLPKDASPIDFAFAVHTYIGYHYRGALVNGKMRSMEHMLQTGDVVEILLHKDETVNRDWLKFSKTSQARQQIRRVLRRQLELE